MSCPGRHLRLATIIGVVFLACAALWLGCGNPEAPKIVNVRLSYWNSVDDDVDDDVCKYLDWCPLLDGEDVQQSPVRIEGNLTDNTAVVNPMITWIGERGDVDESGFKECSHGVGKFYECVMECPEEQAGFFACNPVLPAKKLIRGDRYSLVLNTTQGETFELEILVSEAQDLVVPESDGEPIQVREDYRIIKVSSLEGDPNPFLWSLFHRKTAEGPWLPLRSGDILALNSGDSVFQIGVQVPEGVTLESPPEAAWESLVKWNDSYFLNWDATTGNFVQTFQVFDPRDEQEMNEGVGQSTYRYVVSAEDVPDQKTGEFRYSQVAADLVFSPEKAIWVPDLEVDGDDEDLIESQNPGEIVRGTVQSFSGQVRSVLYALSKGSGSTDPRFLYMDPGLISLGGVFSETIIYVADWDGDGVVDEPEEEGGVPNFLEVVAMDTQGNWARTSVSVSLVLPTASDGPPEMEIHEIFPALDQNGEGLLPFGEQMRLRARAVDDHGQPEFSASQCTYVAGRSLGDVNQELCSDWEPLTGVTGTPETEDDWVHLNAGGEYPRNPWEWIVIEPTSTTLKTIGVLKAKEKVEDLRDKPTAKFTGIQIALDPESESDAYTIKVGIAETQSPAVTLRNLESGDIVDPDSFVVEAVIYPNFSDLNQIKALWNGESRGNPTYDSLTGAFVWDLQAFTVREGDKICVGGISVDGHATLDILAFADTAEGLLLGVTVTPDIDECN